MSLPSRGIGTLVNDTANNSIDVDITAFDFIKYTGAVNGNWDIGTTANFELNSSNAATTYVDAPSPDSVVFDDTATGTHTVNLTTTLHPASVTVNSNAGYTFTGTGSLAGTTGLTTTGTGTLTLLTNNTYTGTTTVNGGTLAVGNGGTAGSLGTGPVVDNAQLTFNRSDAVTVPGNVTGTGSVTAAGTGTLTLAGTNAIGGNLTVAAGSLAVTGTTAVGGAVAGPGAITVNAGGLSVNGTIAADVALTNSGTLTFNNANGVTDANAVTGAGNLAVAGGSATLTGTVNYTGLTTLGANTLTLASQGNTTIGNSITGTGNIVKAGPGTLYLLGSSNGFTGTLTVNAGAVVLDDLGASGDLGASSVVVNNGASFTFGPDNNPDFPDTTVVTVNAGGTFTLGVGEQYGGVVLNGGTYVSGNANVGANTTAIIGYTFNSGTVTTTGTGAGALNGTVNLDKYTDGTVTFAGAATVGTGVTIDVHQGTLAFGTPNFPATGATSITLGDNGTVGTIQLTDGGAAATVRPVNLSGNGGVVNVPNPAGSIAFNGPVTGNAPLTLTGAGRLTLGAPNSYTGDTTVNGGTLVVGPAGTLPGNLIVNAGAAAAFAPSTNASAGALVRTVGNVTVAAGGSLALTPGAAGRSLLVTPSLTLAGTVDLGDNDLDVRNGSLATLTADAATGYAGGTFNGPAGLVGRRRRRRPPPDHRRRHPQHRRGRQPAVRTGARPLRRARPGRRRRPGPVHLLRRRQPRRRRRRGRLRPHRRRLPQQRRPDRLVQRRLQLRRQGRRQRLHPDRQRLQPPGRAPGHVRVARHRPRHRRRHRGRDRRSAGTAAVPEPASVGLLAVGRRPCSAAAAGPEPFAPPVRPTTPGPPRPGVFRWRLHSRPTLPRGPPAPDGLA